MTDRNRHIGKEVEIEVEGGLPADKRRRQSDKEDATKPQEHPGLSESDERTRYRCPVCTRVFDNEGDALDHVYYEEYRRIKSCIDDF